jgi:hypothetical protein
MPSNAAFHSTIETVGFQTAFSETMLPRSQPVTKQKTPRLLFMRVVFSC